ncbi:hypothetical protein [Colwellia sp. E2M01]|uniref:hypothetical protein n=1 Tax=Colwellia sp. E2M01 TaxID=2841561 RepID=UPI001C087F37|nr:hypothetical protein [Colwellia sp. E2M01]MBU2872012.1 hypothetical protein [Colwellia sp. E2M01]
MNSYLKAASIALTLATSAYLPSAMAAPAEVKNTENAVELINAEQDSSVYGGISKGGLMRFGGISKGGLMR